MNRCESLSYCRCSPNAPGMYCSAGELESRHADMHGTPTTPGWGEEAAHLPDSSAPRWRNLNPQELAPFRVCGGCPGFTGPYPSAGLDEWANSMRRITRAQAFGLAFLRPRGSNAPPY